MNRGSRCLACLAAVLLLQACATPQSRIERNPDSFGALSAEQQALVRAGRIAIGFSEEAVRLALGEPQRISRRTDEKGEATVWRYVQRASDGYTDFGYTGYTAFGPYGYPLGFHGAGFNGYGFYGPRVTTIVTSAGPSSERDRLRVTFVGGQVSAIEEELEAPR
jgi:outer membrane protein assembly factor BamE (lipoprotein component of BamABCDE complex)